MRIFAKFQRIENSEVIKIILSKLSSDQGTREYIYDRTEVAGPGWGVRGRRGAMGARGEQPHLCLWRWVAMQMRRLEGFPPK